MSEALVGFNFHFLLFALSLTGSCVVTMLDPTTPDYELGQAVLATIINAVIGFAILEFFYWAPTVLTVTFVNS